MNVPGENDPINLGKGPEIPVSRGLLLAMIKLMRRAEYTAWRKEWNQRACEWCAAPKSSRKHEDDCRWLITIRHLERVYPKLMGPQEVDALDEFRGMEFLSSFIQEMIDDVESGDKS